MTVAKVHPRASCSVIIILGTRIVAVQEAEFAKRPGLMPNASVYLVMTFALTDVRVFETTDVAVTTSLQIDVATRYSLNWR